MPSPEVGQETLQVVGVAQLVFALVGTSHQAAPGSVQLCAFLLDVVHCFRVGLDQALCCLSERVNLGRGMAKLSKKYARLRASAQQPKRLKENLTLSPRAARSLSNPSCLRCKAWTLAKS